MKLMREVGMLNKGRTNQLTRLLTCKCQKHKRWVDFEIVRRTSNGIITRMSLQGMNSEKLLPKSAFTLIQSFGWHLRGVEWPYIVLFVNISVQS